VKNSDNPLIWIEISRSALQKNLQTLRDLLSAEVQLMPMVKANAYGHGLELCGKIFREGGAEYLAVNSIFEARRLRTAGDSGLIYIAGYTSIGDLREAIELNCELVIFNRETLKELQKIGAPVKVHLKVETGINRQGVSADEVSTFARAIQSTGNVQLAGAAMHFADIEDTRDYSFAQQQLAEFNAICARLEADGFSGFLRHAANSAATLLFPETHFDLVRAGIAIYGMWPSREVSISLATEQQADLKKIVLTSALTWKTQIAQIKTIPAGAKVGYGCTFETTKKTKLAILPVGYYDGFTRAYFKRASVLIHGCRAPVIGRVCMNIMMVDITGISNTNLEDEVVLLGKSRDDEITTEEMAEWGDTINYEVTTRIRENILRKVID